MKIRIHEERLKLRHRWTIARAVESGGATDETVLILELEDEDGIIGLGECAPCKRYNEDLDSVRAFLAGVDLESLSFENPEASIDSLLAAGKGNMSAVCGLDIALMDGAARRKGVPLHDYLGLGFEEGRHVTSFSIGIDDPEKIHQKVLEAEEFPILKLKLGHPNDREHLAALRSAAPGKTVRVDGNEAWTTKEKALEMIEWLAGDPGIEFVEQPMPSSTDIEDLVWLKERSPLPLMADESFHNAVDVEHCARGFHSVNAKLIKTGGVLQAYRALKKAREAGLKTMIGCMIETSILISAAAHLSALTDHLDIDGNILISNDPYLGPTSKAGIVSFSDAPRPDGLRVGRRGA